MSRTINSLVRHSEVKRLFAGVVFSVTVALMIPNLAAAVCLAQCDFGIITCYAPDECSCWAQDDYGCGWICGYDQMYEFCN